MLRRFPSVNPAAQSLISTMSYKRGKHFAILPNQPFNVLYAVSRYHISSESPSSAECRHETCDIRGETLVCQWQDSYRTSHIRDSSCLNSLRIRCSRSVICRLVLNDRALACPCLSTGTTARLIGPSEGYCVHRPYSSHHSCKNLSHWLLLRIRGQ